MAIPKILIGIINLHLFSRLMVLVKYLEVPPTSHHENVECNFLYEMEDTKRGKAYISAMKTNIYFELIGKNMNIYYGAGFGSNIDYYLTKQ